MKKFLAGSVVLLAAFAGGFAVVAARHVDKVRPNTFVGQVPVGGLTREEAAFRLRQWWETEKRRPIKLVGVRGLRARTAPELGVAFDDQASVADLPMERFWDKVGSLVSSGRPERHRVVPVFKESGRDLGALKRLVERRDDSGRPAVALYRGGKIETVPERPSRTLDAEELRSRAMQALVSSAEEVKLPLTTAPKRVPDEALQSIREVVAEFSTSFSSSNRTRSANIKLASSKFEGLILMPGERVSFNGVVGRRTLRNGFKLAGVYRNGRHDIDVGGGICQVSTTLYNAALFANLKIVSRANHSMPVPYVPVGRDATVDYGSIDLVLENSYQTPIAIAPEYRPGRLVFRILGTKEPGLEVKVVEEGHKSWDTGSKTVVDAALRPGARKVVEKGSRGHSVKTYRVVYREGREVAREPLGKSHYRGGKRIVAVGPSRSRPAVEAASPAAPLPLTPASTNPN